MNQKLKYCLLALLIFTPFISKSAIINVDFDFDSPDWEATVQFDDQLVKLVESPFPPWNDAPYSISTMRIYGIVSINIKHPLVELETSDFTKHFLGANNTPYVYGKFGALVNTSGHVAILSVGCNSEKFCLGSSWSFIKPDLEPSLILYSSGVKFSESNYTATIQVNEPSKISLALGIMTVLIYLRRVKSRS